MRILLVEDFEKTRTYVTKHLRRAGYATDTAADGEEALLKASSIDYDAIILDLMLPKVNGVEVLKQLRAEGRETHVLILTARTAVDERVEGLQLGADDYLIKPFAVKELLARVEAMVRRRYTAKTNVTSVGALVIDQSGHTVAFDSKDVQLRPRELSLLVYLAQRQGQVVSRAEIERNLYDEATEVHSNSVDSSVYRLRKDLTAVGAENYIRTVHRQGYILKPPTT
jgi:DNA-binding response OmpR family regulator